MWGRMRRVTLAAMTGAALIGGLAASAAGSFPDVPPWHWAYDAITRLQDEGILQGFPTPPAQLAENSILQVYDAFAHATATGARAWVERFTFNRPGNWPAPLSHAHIAAFSVTGAHVGVHDTTASATFTASVQTPDGKTVTDSMRVELRWNGRDWQVDYATLAAGSPLFR
jgi:S-layer homology domain